MTTGSDRDHFTAHRACCERIAPDGGGYLPVRLIPFTKRELMTAEPPSFEDCVSSVLGRYLCVRLSGHDIATSLRLRSFNSRISVGECWDSQMGTFDALVRQIAQAVLGQAHCGPWFEICVRIGTLLWLFGHLRQRGIRGNVDISMSCDGLLGPVSAVIAGRMGVPVGNIVCCVNDSDGIWSLLYHGTIHTGRVAGNNTEGADHLISLLCGPAEAARYLDSLRAGVSYRMEDGHLAKLRRCIRASVVSDQAALRTVSNALSTGGILMSSYTARSYAGLLSYRSAGMENRQALVLGEISPAAGIPGFRGASCMPDNEEKK